MQDAGITIRNWPHVGGCVYRDLAGGGRLELELAWTVVGRAMRPGPQQLNDFYQDWASAHNYWTGLRIYTPHSITIPRYLGAPSNPIPGIEYNLHPPTSVLILLPLGRLGYHDAAQVANVISIVAFLASMVIVTVVLRLTCSLFVLGLSLLAFCHPVYGNLFEGQATLILCCW